MWPLAVALFLAGVVFFGDAGAARAGSDVVGAETAVDLYADFRTEEDAAKFRETKARAERGERVEQVLLAMMYVTGMVVPHDYFAAAWWFRKAAERGSMFAQYELGKFYDEGLGVPQDAAKAMRWYMLAANQGEMTAQYKLGRMNLEGRGIAKDYAAAFWWLSKAADRDSKHAQFSLGRMYENGEGGKARLGSRRPMVRQGCTPGPRGSARQAVEYWPVIDRRYDDVTLILLSASRRVLG